MGPDSINTSRRSSNGDLSLNVAGPTIDRSAFKQALPLEIEAKFFMPRALAQKLTSGLPFVQIEQRYFPKELVRPLLEKFFMCNRTGSNHRDSGIGIAIHHADLADVTIARIRKITQLKQAPKYFIEFKGAKEGDEGARISRREISREISAKQYEALKEDATAGTVRKRRYAIDGTITVRGTDFPAVAQIDRLQAAGKNLQKVSATFDTVDIELRNPSHINALRSGDHSFPFLRGCVELSAHHEKLAKPLTTRRLAKKGIHPDAVNAIKQLEAEAQKRYHKKLN